MKSMKRNPIIYLLAFILVLQISGCNKSSNEIAQACENAQKAKFKDLTGLDGCGMVIQLQNGCYLEPINLCDMDIEIKDGQKIWVSYHSVPNMASICMVGDIVEIDCIAPR